MKNQEQLINNIIGQLNGIKKMIEEEKSCADIMTQLKAAKSALDSLTAKFLKDNLDKCVNSSGKIKDKKMLEKLISEIIKK